MQQEREVLWKYISLLFGAQERYSHSKQTMGIRQGHARCQKKAVASLNRKLLKRDLHFYNEDLLQEIIKIVRTRATEMICKQRV